ncbi:unnamed protein product [Brachionus calyciflorus]|uniref:beta-glucosidase n=1 Tax=Brachionus calyciflorus TaxID=104777 RepID=A0A814DRQ4_9BILA|nr:unnamed protein product [Brachionus calyciflorus]
MLKLAFILAFLTVCVNSIDIDKLLQSMSNEQKCGQMTQITFELVQNDKQENYDENPVNFTKAEYAIKEKNIGSILNAPFYVAQKASTWQKVLQSLQNVSLSSDSKIPILFGLDSIHGAQYIQEAVLFPHSVSMAGSFNLDIAKKVGEITSLETRASGIPWNFNPVFDVGRQPLWPRIFETYGEDTYLAGKMGEAYIHGSQGDNIKNRTKVATCLKHYIGYSLPFNGRDRTPALIPENLLREVFLPPFEKGVLAGSPTVMANSGEVNGMPGHANYHYLTEILKVRLYTRDKMAETPEEAVRIAVMAGVDMSMVPNDYSFYDHCVNLTKKDLKFMDRVNDATRRILKVKDQLGLFENPYPFDEDVKKVGQNESHEFNLEAARESIVLAKNENNFLPLNENENKTILVVGPSGNILRNLNGGWSYTWQGNVEEHFRNFGLRKRSTIFDAIKQIQNSSIDYSEGSNFTHVTNLQETLSKANDSDILILTIGEDSYCETPGNINNLLISESQQQLADELFKLNKPVVLVYIGGRPRIISNIVERSNAVLIGLLPGERGSEAIAEILYGKYNPDARLSITYPLEPNGFSTYDHKPLEVFDINVVSNLFPFGHGLSYTHFNYSNLRLSKTEISNPDGLTVTVNVNNTGHWNGKESVLLFLNDECGSVTRPVKQLKGFKKIYLEKGQSTDVTFQIDFMDLSFINMQNKRIVEAGKFNVMIGDLKASFNVLKGSDDQDSTTITTTVETTQQPTTISSTSQKNSANFNGLRLTTIFFYILIISFTIIF